MSDDQDGTTEPRPGAGANRPADTRNELAGTTRDAVQARSISGGVHFHHGGVPESWQRPRQLPGDVSRFVNRARELDQLDAVLPGRSGDPLTVAVLAIAGTAGAGKTSLALRWSHRVAHRFPDGQLYVNLRGYDAGHPVSAQQALHGFLTALGVRPRAVPPDLDTAAALYRSVLADRRALVVLDNAASAAQVRPLLPGGPGTLTLVTSRSRLSGLAVRDGALRITLGTLPETEAVALIRAFVAGYRAEDDPGELTELARLCARLPLALRIAAERAASRPRLRLDDLIADLRDRSILWETLSTGDEEDTEGVRTVFAWSYRALPAHAARLFRLLGLHSGPDFGLHAVAALAALSASRARQTLDVLVGAHLLEQTGPDRYEFHDLLRAYAMDQVQREEGPDERGTALRRLLDWYLHTADVAQGWLEPGEDHLGLGEPADGVTPLVFADYDEAVDWSEREHANLLAAVRAAGAAGMDEYAWRLSAVLFNASAPSAPFADWVEATRLGLDAVRRLGNRAGEARMLECLGMAYTQTSQLGDALACHEAARTIRSTLDDRMGQAQSLNFSGLVHLRRRELAAAEARFQDARATFSELRDSFWESIALVNLADTRHQAGRLEEAARDAVLALHLHRVQRERDKVGNALRLLSAIHLDQGEVETARQEAAEALDISLDLRNHTLEGYWLIALGNAQQALGAYGDALESFQRSASLHRRLGDRSREALAWHCAGRTYRAMGRPAEAARFHHRAAVVHHELGDRWHEALAVDGLAAATADEGHHERARRHWADALNCLAAYDDVRATALRTQIETRLPEHS